MANHLEHECDLRRSRARFSVDFRWMFLAATLVLFPGMLAGKANAQRLANKRPPVVALACSPDGEHILAGGQFGVEVYDLPAGKHLDEQGAPIALKQPARTLDVQMANVHAIAFSPAGDQVAIGGGAPSDGGALAVYSWPEFEVLFRAEPHTDLIYGIAWSTDGKQLATVSYDRDVKLLSATDGSETTTLAGHSRPVLDVTWLPNAEAQDSGIVATVGVDRSLRIWNVTDAKLLRSLENHTQTIQAIAARPNQQAKARPMVATAGADKTVRFWQPTIGRLVRFARLEAVPLDLVWTSDGQTAIAACEDGSLRMINPETANVTQIKQISKARLECVDIVMGRDAEAHRIAISDSQGQVFLVNLQAGK